MHDLVDACQKHLIEYVPHTLKEVCFLLRSTTTYGNDGYEEEKWQVTRSDIVKDKDLVKSDFETIYQGMYWTKYLNQSNIHVEKL